MNQLRPGAIATLAGGVVLLISTFLDWLGPVSAWNGTIFGLTGLFVFIIGALCAAVAGIKAFAPQIKLPENIVGLSLNQAVLGLGASVFILTLSLLFRNDSAKIGTILALLSSAAIVVGAYLEINAEGTSEPTRAI